MLRTPRASDFLIFMPSIDYLKLSSRNCFDFNIIFDLIKCFTIIYFFNFQFMYLFYCDDFDDLMLYLFGSNAYIPYLRSNMLMRFRFFFN